MFAVRRAVATKFPRYTAASAFHSTARASVEIGQAIPDVELHEGTPGNKVSLAKELASKRGIIVGVPAAFSPSCSATHIPGYLSSPKLKNAGSVFVVAVNDAFVMKAWSESLKASSKESVRFLADPSGAFTSALDLAFDAPQVFGHPRSKRYALVIENGEVAEAHVEPDNTGVDVSSAEKVLK